MATVPQAIPDIFKSATLNSSDKRTIWSLRINVNSQYEKAIIDCIKDAMTERCSKAVIGPKEIGTNNGVHHYHCAFHLKRDSSQSAVANKFVHLHSQRVHMQDYCLLPSAAYFVDDYEHNTLIDYALKQGEPTFTIGKILKTPKVTKDAKAKEKQDEVCTRLGIDPDALQVVKYEAVLIAEGELEAKRLFPAMHYKTEGKSVRKQNVNDKWIDPDIRTGTFENIWIEGGAGTGKNCLLDVLHPGRYCKEKSTKYWESYNYKNHTTSNNHMAVHFDEIGTAEDILGFSGNGKSLDYFKIMFGDSAFPIEIKHEAQQLTRFKKGYVTTNDKFDAIMLEITRRSNDTGNVLKGFNAKEFENAIKRRFKFIHISEMLNVYKCFTVKKDTSTGFGGVFHNSLKDELRNRIDLIDETYGGSTDLNDKIKRLECFDALKKEFHNETIKLLEPLRWLSIDAIISLEQPAPKKSNIIF